MAQNRPVKQDTALEEIKAALACHPSFGYKRLTAVVNRECRKQNRADINREKVYRIVKEEQLLFGKPKQLVAGYSRKHDGKVAVEQSNQRWCSDGLEFKCMNGETITMTFVMDCCDREVISFVAKVGRGLAAWMAQEQVLLAVNRRFGNVQCVPKELQLLTDNGSAYTSKATRRLLKTLGIEDCKTAVCSPQSNGMAESMVKTLKRDYLPFIDRTNAASALCALPEMVEKYNAEHPHSALHYLSPLEFRLATGEKQLEPSECADVPICLIPGFVVMPDRTSAGIH